MAFFDLAKAFDSLDRTILYETLKSYGIREVELDWFVNYFCPREQFTVYNDAISSVLGVDFGVAQGSIAGPLICIVFMNDIINSCSLAKFVMFADDKIFLCHLPISASCIIQ